MAIRTVTRAGVGLVIGIILLAALVLGGLWLVRDRGEQARREDAISIAEQQLREESDDEIALNPSEEAEQQPAEQAPAQEQAPAATATPPAQAPTVAQPNAATTLPQTGPAEQLGSLVVIALVVFSVTTYVTSNRQLRKIY